MDNYYSSYADYFTKPLPASNNTSFVYNPSNISNNAAPAPAVVYNHLSGGSGQASYIGVPQGAGTGGGYLGPLYAMPNQYQPPPPPSRPSTYQFGSHNRTDAPFGTNFTTPHQRAVNPVPPPTAHDNHHPPSSTYRPSSFQPGHHSNSGDGNSVARQHVPSISPFGVPVFSANNSTTSLYSSTMLKRVEPFGANLTGSSSAGPGNILTDPILKAVTAEAVKKVAPSIYGFRADSGALSGNRKMEKYKKYALHKALFSCEACNKKFKDNILYDKHCATQKHQARALQLESAKLAIAEGRILKIDGCKESKFFCEPCKLHLNSVVHFDIHVRGAKHKRQVDLIEFAKRKKDEVEEIKRAALLAVNKLPPKTSTATIGPQALPLDITAVKNKIINASPAIEYTPAIGNKFVKGLKCEACGIQTNAATQLAQHVESRKHKVKCVQVFKENPQLHKLP